MFNMIKMKQHIVYIAIILIINACSSAPKQGDSAALVMTIAELEDDNIGAVATDRLVKVARYGEYAVVRLLVLSGQDPNVMDTFGNTPLIVAAAEGHSRVVKLLIAEGADVGLVSAGGVSALSAAAVKGHGAVVKVLINADADINARNIHGETALVEAVKHGRLNIVELLLIHDAYPNTRNSDAGITGYGGYTALMYAAQHGIFFHDGADWEQIIKLLLLGGADPTLKRIHGQTAIMVAEFYGHDELVILMQAVIPNTNEDLIYGGLDYQQAFAEATRRGDLARMQVLINHGADVNKLTAGSAYPLLIAVTENNVKTMVFLLAHDAHIKALDMNGKNALMAAAEKGYLDIAALLVEHGLAVNLVQGSAVLTTRDSAKNVAGRNTALTLAAQNNHSDIVELLLNAGADPDHQGSVFRTVLVYAVSASDEKLVSILLEQGADTDIKDATGMSALLVAAQRGHLEIINLLLSYRADPEIADSNSGNTALLFAAEYGHLEIVRRLFTSGVDINHTNKQGQSAWSLARAAGHKDIAYLLEEVGAKTR